MDVAGGGSASGGGNGVGGCACIVVADCWAVECLAPNTNVAPQSLSVPSSPMWHFLGQKGH